MRVRSRPRQSQTWSLASAVREAAATVHREHGMAGFALGVHARVLWLSVGGALFLGFYEAARSALLRAGVS